MVQIKNEKKEKEKQTRQKRTVARSTIWGSYYENHCDSLKSLEIDLHHDLVSYTITGHIHKGFYCLL